MHINCLFSFKMKVKIWICKKLSYIIYNCIYIYYMYTYYVYILCIHIMYTYYVYILCIHIIYIYNYITLRNGTFFYYSCSFI